MFNLSSFISNQNGQDFARGYVFYVAFEDCPYITTGEKGRYLVKSSSLPAEQLGQAVANWQGNEYKIATTSEYTDFTVDFNVDPDDSIRTDFVNWKKAAHDVRDNTHGIPPQYMWTITLEHLSHVTGDPVLTYKLQMAWPSNVGELTLDYSAKEIATFSVTFAYQWHTVE